MGRSIENTSTAKRIYRNSILSATVAHHRAAACRSTGAFGFTADVVLVCTKRMIVWFEDDRSVLTAITVLLLGSGAIQTDRDRFVSRTNVEDVFGGGLQNLLRSPARRTKGSNAPIQKVCAPARVVFSEKRAHEQSVDGGEVFFGVFVPIEANAPSPRDVGIADGSEPLWIGEAAQPVVDAFGDEGCVRKGKRDG